MAVTVKVHVVPVGAVSTQFRLKLNRLSLSPVNSPPPQSSVTLIKYGSPFCQNTEPSSDTCWPAARFGQIPGGPSLLNAQPPKKTWTDGAIAVGGVPARTRMASVRLPEPPSPLVARAVMRQSLPSTGGIHTP